MKYNNLSSEAQSLLRRRLRCDEDTPLGDIITSHHLDQVDITLILLDAGLNSDVRLLTGISVAHYPDPQHFDPWEIDNWATDRWHPRIGPAGTTVRQAVAHGVTYDHIDELQSLGHLKLEPRFPRGPQDETIEQRAEWLADWVARHPNPNDVDNWRVTHVGVPTRADHRPLTQVIRLGMTVRQVILRGVSWPLLDGAMRDGWLQVDPA